MLVSHALYKVFYSLLRDRLILEVWNGKVPKGKTVNSPLLWDVCYKDGPDKGKAIPLILFQSGAITDSRYFYRRYSDFRNRPTYDLDDMSFYKALLYVQGVSVEELLQANPINLKSELDAVYNEFSSRYQAKIAQVAILDKNPATRLLLSDEERLQLEKTLEVTDEMINNDIESVKGVVNKFYNSISIKALTDAWDHLSPSFKNRVWQGDYDRFAEGYVNMRGLRGIAVEDAKQPSPFIIDCIVSYEDEIEAWSSLEFNALNGITVKDLDEFARLIRKIQEAVEGAGGTGFEKIELHRFFDPAASEYIWYKCGLQSDQLSQVFSRQKTIFVKRRYSCTCHMVEGKWYIERVRALATWGGPM